VKIRHIYSHHYVFSIPKLVFVFERMQRRYGIIKARIRRNIFVRSLLDELDVTLYALGVDPDFGGPFLARSN